MRSRTLLLLSMLVVIAGAAAAGLLLSDREKDDAGVNSPPTLKLGFQLIADGLERPVQATTAGDGSGRLFVVEQPGRARIVKDGQLLPQPFLDIVPLVGSSGNEQGLLSIAFHPRYAENGLFYVDYTNVDGDSVVARYRVSPDDPDRADPASAKQLLLVDQPAANHNGGLLLFGPDGDLYIGFGDGGGGGSANGQRLDTPLGKILRIDVDHADDDAPYAVPADNPFVNTRGAAPEIWLTGLRNPWRFNFDRDTGDLYIGDVGSGTWEEIDVVPAGVSGLNFGWPVFEGPNCISTTAGCGTPDLSQALGFTAPVAWYDHSQRDCAVTGGFVYHGNDVPSLKGVYLFGDYCSGKLGGMIREDNGGWLVSDPLDTDFRVSSFGQDEAGELYVVDLLGGVYRITSGP